ncbi:hypothetical protein TI05_04700 [Achromatium sp. WMS3]|nr:hypothetical protein TI05_04700 [Achromatium sp. WMS3]
MILNGLEEGRIMSLNNSTQIGRRADPNNQVILAHDNRISGIHARITITGSEQEAILEDLNSRYGTLVNAKQIKQPTPLNIADTIQLGVTLLYVLPEPDAKVEFLATQSISNIQ